MRERLTFALAVLMVALAVFVTISLIDSQAAQRGRVSTTHSPTEGRVKPTESVPAEVVQDVKDWPACEDAAPGEACQMFDDFDGDGTNTVGYFPDGM